MGFMDTGGILKGVTLSDANMANINTAMIDLTMNTAVPSPSAITFINEYLRVPGIATPGKVTDVQSALNAVQQVGGGSIVLENGTFTAPAGGWIVPDVNLDIQGTTQGGTVLKNTPGSDLWVLHNLTKTFSFKQFSIESQNVAAFSKMFTIYGTTLAQNTADVIIADLCEILADDDIANHYIGDTGIYVATGNGKVAVSNARIIGGKYGLDAVGHKDVSFSGGELTHQTTTGISFDTVSRAKASGNNLFDQLSKGICVASVSGLGIQGMIENNKVFFMESTAVHTALRGIESGFYNDMSVTNNYVECNLPAHNASVRAMYCYGLSRAKIKGNTAFLNVTSNTGQYGVFVAYSNDLQIGLNVIKIDNDDYTSNAYGIFLQNFSGVGSLRNIISGNSVNMVNNNAMDIGISVETNCNNNQGSDNVTTNVGTALSNAGTNNYITGLDDGTPF
jgi:hypothetical protein